MTSFLKSHPRQTINTDNLTVPQLSFADYEIQFPHLQEGGWGKVYSAKLKKNPNEFVAMKFFGYTKQQPITAEIMKEINLMKNLVGVDGVVQLIGVFSDTPNGYIPDKTPSFYRSYPVIVMEMLHGGDLFQQISTRTNVSENYLAISFKSAITALHTVHEKGYIHRDLKLDNLMNVSKADGSKMKLIDFGFMVALPPSGVLVTPGNLVGTEGWFAPESILNFEYSTKSDIWQFGCILYTMLAGHPPFHSNPKYRYQITRLTYSPMKGPAWDNISSEAKDLVDKMLTKDPSQRITIEGILAHPWLQSPASEVDLGEDYYKRIKSMALRHKLKRAFLAHNLHDHLSLRQSFHEVLPFLKPPSNQSSDPNSPTANSASCSSLIDDNNFSQEFSCRLLKLKEILVSAIFDSSDQQDDHDHGNDHGDETHDSRPSAKRRKLTHYGEIDYLAFCSLVETANLEILAAPQIFSIFDTDGSGTIDMKEFLLTLLALRPSGNENDELEAAKLYFSIFDVDEDGYIGENELELVVGCLLHDGAGPLLVTSDHDVNTPNIEEMFQIIDTNHDGRIDFEEFREFYNAVLLPSSRQSSFDLTQNASEIELGYTQSQVFQCLNDSFEDDI